MFVLNEAAESAAKEEQAPAEDAPVLELMQYNFRRLQAAWLGSDPAQRAKNQKLALNAAMYAGTVGVFVQFGHYLVF